MTEIEQNARNAIQRILQMDHEWQKKLVGAIHLASMERLRQLRVEYAAIVTIDGTNAAATASVERDQLDAWGDFVQKVSNLTFHVFAGFDTNEPGILAALASLLQIDTSWRSSLSSVARAAIVKKRDEARLAYVVATSLPERNRAEYWQHEKTTWEAWENISTLMADILVFYDALR